MNRTWIQENNTTNCFYLPSKVPGNRTAYCGIKEEWKPRFSKPTIIAMCIIPVLVVFLFYIFTVKKIWKSAREQYEKELEEALKASSDGCIVKILKCCYSRENSHAMKLYCTIVFMTLIKYSIDCLDILFDVYMFYTLENGNELDQKIYRNPHVNSSIYAFGILAFYRLWFWQRIEQWLKPRFHCKCIEHKPVNSNLSRFERFKFNAIIIGYAIEDGPELFLEYFFIEKYIYGQKTWYFIPHNFILGSIYLYLIYDCFKIAFAVLCSLESRNLLESTGQTVRNICRKFNPINLVLQGFYYVLIPSIGIVQLMRSFGAVFYYLKDDLDPKCLSEIDGRLVQTPFNCLNHIDYIILINVVLQIPLLIIIRGLFIVNSSWICIKNLRCFCYCEQDTLLRQQNDYPTRTWSCCSYNMIPKKDDLDKVKSQLPPMRTDKRIPCLRHKKLVFEETQRLLSMRNAEEDETIIDDEPLGINIMYETAL